MKMPIIVALFILFTHKNHVKQVWSDNRKLTLNDYKKVDPGDSKSAYGAQTFHQVLITWSISDDSIEYGVGEMFNPDSSWMKIYQGKNLSESQINISHYQETRGLQHEQGHFDIGEVFARKIRALLSNYRYLKNESLLSDSINVLMKERKATETQYDSETLHSQDSVKQMEWIYRISAMLDSLKQFSSPDGRVCIK